jgi:hypothetical protein
MVQRSERQSKGMNLNHGRDTVEEIEHFILIRPAYVWPPIFRHVINKGDINV